MTKIPFQFFLLLLLMIVYSCTNSTGEDFTIKMSDVTSSKIIISESYSNLIKHYGQPDWTNKMYFRRYQPDYSYKKDSCLVLFYKEMDLQYFLIDDSVKICAVNLGKHHDYEIDYNSCRLNSQFSIRKAKRCFDVADTSFWPMISSSAMCGLDSSGYELSLSIEEGCFADHCDFYFGEDRCLKGIYFPFFRYSDSKN